MRRLITSIALVLAISPLASGNPYRPIVRAGDTLYVSGQVGTDPKTDDVVGGGISNEVRQTLANIKRLVEAEGAAMAHVVKCTVFLLDMSDFDAMNAVYRGFFPDKPPARTTVQVAALPDPNAHVEIDCIAVVPAR